jgi:hypothetical protein
MKCFILSEEIMRLACYFNNPAEKVISSINKCSASLFPQKK